MAQNAYGDIPRPTCMEVRLSDSVRGGNRAIRRRLTRIANEAAKGIIVFALIALWIALLVAMLPRPRYPLSPTGEPEAPYTATDTGSSTP